MPDINWEGVKTVLVFVLITGIVTFVAGMRYADQRQAEIDTAVQAASVEIVSTDEPSKK